ncbi:unnamed protein product [Pipistrellus nathusii]|uniref:Uncharacterized protein n=1 Tax=Pipistrellus nathusii TaxID=59473 RepID=A0ABN9ZGS3_PIPNA
MQSLTQQLHAGLMQPEMTQLLLPPYETTVPYDSRVSYDTIPDPSPQETKQPQEWKPVESEPEEPQGTLEWPRPPQQTTLLLIVCGLFLFLVLTGMPAAFYI